jgi:hypothetical protein
MRVSEAPSLVRDRSVQLPVAGQYGRIDSREIVMLAAGEFAVVEFCLNEAAGSCAHAAIPDMPAHTKNALPMDPDTISSYIQREKHNPA